MVIFITVVGSFPMANWLSPNVRSDPFTGDEGDELFLKIKELSDDYSAWKKEHQVWVRLAALSISRLEGNSKHFTDSIRVLNVELKIHEEKFDVLNHKVTSHQSKMIEINRRQDLILDEYFRLRN